MAKNKRSEREKRKRQKQARKALESFLGRLRNACETLDKMEQWLEHVQALESILHDYQDALPSASKARLRSAMRVVDATSEGLAKACQVLQLEVENMIALLPVAAGLSLGSVLIAVLIVSAVAVGVIVAVSAATTVPLSIQNTNCPDIQFSQIPLSLPGLELPQGALAASSTAEAKLPPWVRGAIDASSSPVMLRILFQSLAIPPDVTSIRLTDSAHPGGMQLLNPGQSTPFSLAGGQQATLTVQCGP